MRFLKSNSKKEPWQIAAARYCVGNAEKGFTKKGLGEHIESSYSVNKNYIEQFYNEEIYKPAGRDHTRDFVKTEDGGLWMPPLDLVSKITDYDELQEARVSSKRAIYIAIGSLLLAIVIGIFQIWSTYLTRDALELSAEPVLSIVLNSDGRKSVV